MDALDAELLDDQKPETSNYNSSIPHESTKMSSNTEKRNQKNEQRNSNPEERGALRQSMDTPNKNQINNLEQYDRVQSVVNNDL